jgi:NADPH:quinone reductase-like Zn-dependent oxidoreductase
MDEFAWMVRIKEMKAAYITAFSKALENLRVETVPDPILISGEAKIKILAASVNPSDVKNVQGKMEDTILPRIPGRDFAGVVVDGPATLLSTEVWGTGGDVGFTRDGTHAEFIVVPVEAVTPKPRRLSFEQAACVGVNFVTAYLGLATRARLQPGETLLVNGARGGVGSAVLQLGQALKARLIAVDRKPFEPAVFKGLDLAGYVDTSQIPLGDAVRQITNGQGADVAFDCVGGELFEPVLSSLGQLGRHIAITSVGTRRVSFDLLNFYHRRLTLFGIDSRALTVTDSSKLLGAMTPDFEAGRLQPSPIAKRGTLADVCDLYAFVNNDGVGKAVLSTPTS